MDIHFGIASLALAPAALDRYSRERLALPSSTVRHPGPSPALLFHCGYTVRHFPLSGNSEAFRSVLSQQLFVTSYRRKQNRYPLKNTYSLQTRNRQNQRQGQLPVAP